MPFSLRTPSLVFLWLWLGSLLAQAPSALPKAPVRPVTDTYFGTKLIDPYRWMENGDNRELLTWVKAQSAYTRAYLERRPEYADLLRRCREIDSGDIQVQRIVRSGQRYLYAKLKPGENLAKLYLREANSRSERLVYDPAKDSTTLKHVSLGDFQISPDGHYASYLLIDGGSESGNLHCIDLNTGRNLPDVVANTRWSAGSWAPDGKSLLYFHFQGAAPNVSRAAGAPTTFLHRLGTSASEDKPVLGHGVDAHIVVNANESAAAEFRAGSRYAVGLVNSGGVSPESDVYLANAADLAAQTPDWRKVASRADKVKAVELNGDDLYLLSFKGAPHYQILKTNARNPDVAHAKVVVPPDESIIQDIGAAADGLYFEALKGGRLHIYKLDYKTNRKEEIPLLPDTSGELIKPNLTHRGTLLRINAWTHAPSVYSWDPSSRKLVNTGIQPPSKFEKAMSKIEVTTTQIPSWDGARIPLVIFKNKGTELNGKNSLLLTGYGAYGVSVTSPNVITEYLPWLEKGGILATAGVRGGGEFGEDWHVAGTVANKPNSWKDFLACAEYLVAQRYTNPKHLAAASESAGGIMIGNSFIERPDLFRAIVMLAPVTNMVRFETTPLGPFNTTEYGTLKTEEGFRALLAMDSYHKVKDHVAYPAVLFEGGLDDARVNPFFSAKMCARLQAATSSSNPVLMDFFEDVGHGVGNSQEQSSKLEADEFVFLLAQLAE